MKSFFSVLQNQEKICFIDLMSIFVNRFYFFTSLSVLFHYNTTESRTQNIVTEMNMKYRSCTIKYIYILLQCV